jgi:hypothetical protein
MFLVLRFFFKSHSKMWYIKVDPTGITVYTLAPPCFGLYAKASEMGLASALIIKQGWLLRFSMPANFSWLCFRWPHILLTPVDLIWTKSPAL